MRKIFILALAALLLGVGVVAVIETDPGYILVSYGNYTLETSVWVGLVLLVLATLLVYLVVRLVHRLVAGQHSLVDWLGSRKTRRSARLTNRGIISYTEGNWSRARAQLLRGARNSDSPLVNYLVAARASDRLHEPEKVSEYLAAAEVAESEAAAAVALTDAELKLQAGQYEQALAALERVHRDAGRHPGALDLRQRAYRGLERWESLVALLPDLKKQGVLPEAELARLERDACIGMLKQSTSRGEGPAGERLRAAWERVPSRSRREPGIVGAYAGMLVEEGEHQAAEKLLAGTLKHHWDPQLVRLYGYTRGASPQRQLAQAESWLSAHPDDTELLLCLGRLSARDKLWGKARDYFESSYRLERRPETCAELGRLLVALGEPKVAAAYFREGLLQFEPKLPDLPMPENFIPESKRLAHS